MKEFRFMFLIAMAALVMGLMLTVACGDDDDDEDDGPPPGYTCDEQDREDLYNEYSEYVTDQEYELAVDAFADYAICLEYLEIVNDYGCIDDCLAEGEGCDEADCFIEFQDCLDVCEYSPEK